MFTVFSAVASLAGKFFGSSDNGKGIVSSVSDTVDEWIPSETTKHEMSIEDLKAGDESQNSAREMVLAPSHESWLDILVDAVNRSIRPVFSVWAFGILAGWWDAPQTHSIEPIVLNIIWTIVTFWFGARVLFKDLPGAMRKFKNLK